MRLTVIGCSGSVPGPDSPASCYLVEHEGFRMLLDLGNGAMGALARYASIDSIDAILISHLHADHCIDLTAAYVARRYAPGPARPVLAVHGPAGTGRRIARAYAAAGSGSGGRAMNGVFDFVDFPAEPELAQPEQIGPFQVSTARMAHPVACHAMRISAAGRTLAYSGDTGPTAALTALAAGADVALFEASGLSDQPMPPDLHLTAAQAAQHAAEAEVPRLILTHVPPWNDPAAALAEGAQVFPGQTEMAHCGLVVDI